MFVRGVLYVILNAFLIAFLSACYSTGVQISDRAKKYDSAIEVFVDYSRAVKLSANFESIAENHFHSSTLKEFRSKRGWAKFVYTASYDGLKNGNCDWLDIDDLYEVRVNRILLKCEGSYEYMIFGEPHDERMTLRVFVVQKDGKWFIEKSSLTHTQGSGDGYPQGHGNYAPITKGLKFSSP